MLKKKKKCFGRKKRSELQIWQLDRKTFPSNIRWGIDWATPLGNLSEAHSDLRNAKKKHNLWFGRCWFERYTVQESLAGRFSLDREQLAGLLKEKKKKAPLAGSIRVLLCQYCDRRDAEWQCHQRCQKACDFCPSCLKVMNGGYSKGDRRGKEEGQTKQTEMQGMTKKEKVACLHLPVHVKWFMDITVILHMRNSCRTMVNSFAIVPRNNPNLNLFLQVFMIFLTFSMVHISSISVGPGCLHVYLKSSFSQGKTETCFNMVDSFPHPTSVIQYLHSNTFHHFCLESKSHRLLVSSPSHVHKNYLVQSHIEEICTSQQSLH